MSMWFDTFPHSCNNLIISLNVFTSRSGFSYKLCEYRTITIEFIGKGIHLFPDDVDPNESFPDRDSYEEGNVS